MKIVCFHLNQVGDLAFSLPALKCLRDSYPDATIISVARPGAKELLESTELVDKVLCRNNKLNLDKVKLAVKLLRERFDLAVVFSQSAECAVLACCSGARRRIGFIDTSLGFLLSRQVEFHHPPSTENNLRLVAAAGAKITCNNYVGLLKATPSQVSRADSLLILHGIDPDQPLVALSPGTSGRRSVKEWTDEGFAAVGEHLVKQGVAVVILGTQPALGITSNCPTIVDLSGKTKLGEVVGVLSRCRALIAVDSGILHLGGALGVRVVGLYGPSNSRITGPQGSGHVILTSGAECSPCVRTVCKNERKCMTNLDQSQVIDAVDSIISQL